MTPDLSRRRFFGVAASLLAAPAIVRFEAIMPVRSPKFEPNWRDSGLFSYWTVKWPERGNDYFFILDVKDSLNLPPEITTAKVTRAEFECLMETTRGLDRLAQVDIMTANAYRALWRKETFGDA